MKKLGLAVAALGILAAGGAAAQYSDAEGCGQL